MNHTYKEWYSTQRNRSHVYHNNKKCEKGNDIERKYYHKGRDVNRELCHRCEQLNTMATGLGSVLSIAHKARN